MSTSLWLQAVVRFLVQGWQVGEPLPDSGGAWITHEPFGVGFAFALADWAVAQNNAS